VEVESAASGHSSGLGSDNTEVGIGSLGEDKFVEQLSSLIVSPHFFNVLDSFDDGHWSWADVPKAATALADSVAARDAALQFALSFFIIFKEVIILFTTRAGFLFIEVSMSFFDIVDHLLVAPIGQNELFHRVESLSHIS
jgi:hypothetical protein